MFCTNCGNEIKEDAQVCPFCGQKINFALKSTLNSGIKPLPSLQKQRTEKQFLLLLCLSALGTYIPILFLANSFIMSGLPFSVGPAELFLLVLHGSIAAATAAVLYFNKTCQRLCQSSIVGFFLVSLPIIVPYLFWVVILNSEFILVGMLVILFYVGKAVLSYCVELCTHKLSHQANEFDKQFDEVTTQPNPIEDFIEEHTQILEDMDAFVNETEKERQTWIKEQHENEVFIKQTEQWIKENEQFMKK